MYINLLVIQFTNLIALYLLLLINLFTKNLKRNHQLVIFRFKKVQIILYIVDLF